MSLRIALSLLSFSLLTPWLSAQGTFQHTFEWRKMAQRIVERLSLQPGEKVLLITHPGRFEELIPHLRYAVIEAGGVDLGNLDVAPAPFPESWDMKALMAASEQTRAALRQRFEGIDAFVKLPGAQAGPAYLAAQDLLREEKGRTVHFHWEGAYPLYGQNLPPQWIIDGTYQKALLETDYDEIAQLQGRFEEAMRGNVVRVTTPDGTDIQFRIGDRPVTRQDGDASAARAGKARNLIDREIELPCGAIRVAPLEDSVQGTIVMAESIWAGRPVRNLRLEFENGRVSRMTAGSNLEAVEREMERAGDAGRSFREFALGFNPLLTVPEEFSWIPYYGYGAGVVRLSLGDNSELGGAVTGGYVRWNFFVDATVTVGDQEWVSQGMFKSQASNPK